MNACLSRYLYSINSLKRPQISNYNSIVTLFYRSQSNKSPLSSSSSTAPLNPPVPTLSSISKVLKPISPDISTISCTIVDDKGTVRAVSKKFPRTRFLQQNKLFPRDLRKIDSSNVDVAPTIAVRSNGILINMLHIKALIKRNEVLVFDTSSPKSAGRLSLFMYDLESKLKTKVVHTGMLGYNNNSLFNNNHPNFLNQSYEFKALECILVNVMAVLETELRNNLEKIGKILNELDSQIDRTNLKDLLVNSKGLTTFYQKSLLIRNTLDELLDNDEDLENMYLTENYKLKQNLDNSTNNLDSNKTNKTNLKQKQQIDVIQSNDEDFVASSIKDSTFKSIPKDSETLFQQVGTQNRDTDEVEMLLESYYKQCDEIVQQAETLINDIKSTEDIVNIILDANRNSLMVFELRVAIFTLGFTIATILPAFYGMNLKNYIEESSVAFGGVVFVSLMMGGLMSVIYLRRLRDIRRMTIVSSKTLDKFDEKSKKKILDNIRENGLITGNNCDKRGRLEKDVIWKWLIDEHK